MTKAERLEVIARSAEIRMDSIVRELRLRVFGDEEKAKREAHKLQLQEAELRDEGEAPKRKRKLYGWNKLMRGR